MKNKKFDYRDVAWLCLGLWCGFVLCFTLINWWFNIHIYDMITSIPIDSVNINMNETEMVNAIYDNLPLEYYMNK